MNEERGIENEGEGRLTPAKKETRLIPTTIKIVENIAFLSGKCRRSQAHAGCREYGTARHNLGGSLSPPSLSYTAREQPDDKYHQSISTMASTDPSTLYASSQDALKPLLEAVEASKDANIMTIRSLVLKIFSEPNVFAGYDQVKGILAPALPKSGTEGEKISKTLDLFSYGTYRDYVKDTSPFLPLTDSHIFKLRQLTVVSIVQTFAFQKNRIIPYQEFQQALDLSTGRQVEEVLISCIYAGVMGAKLCQKTNSLKLDPTRVFQTRDVPATQVTNMVEQLQAMRKALQQSQQATQNSRQAVSRELDQYQAFWKQAEDRKKAKAEAPRGWDAEGLAGDITAAVRRQKRSRGGPSGVVENSFGRFQL
eukprot:scaffold567_cov170-Amphora_coffeaeformis.AAC.10